MTKYSFTRDITRQEWPSLLQDFKKGDIVTKREDTDYGLVAQDLRLDKKVTIAVHHPDHRYFFTVPKDVLEKVKEDAGDA